jgi:hypothetical protein
MGYGGSPQKVNSAGTPLVTLKEEEGVNLDEERRKRFKLTCAHYHGINWKDSNGANAKRKENQVEDLARSSRSEF